MSIKKEQLSFYMGGDIRYNGEVVANLKIDGLPIKYKLEVKKNIYFLETRDLAIEKLIEILEND